MTAEKSAVGEKYFRLADEKAGNNLLRKIVGNLRFPAGIFEEPKKEGDVTSPDNLFRFQAEVIRELASAESCVIVGRCADYALADYKNCINLFIFGDDDVKTKRIMARYDLTEAKAKEMITKKDKQRQSYYNYYSSKKWGRADSYDLCINSSILGIEGTVKLIIQYVEDFEKKNNADILEK